MTHFTSTQLAAPITDKLIRKFSYRLWRYEASRGLGHMCPPSAYQDAARHCLIATHTGNGQMIHWSNRAYHYYRLEYVDDDLEYPPDHKETQP